MLWDYRISRQRLVRNPPETKLNLANRLRKPDSSYLICTWYHVKSSLKLELFFTGETKRHSIAHYRLNVSLPYYFRRLPHASSLTHVTRRFAVERICSGTASWNCARDAYTEFLLMECSMEWIQMQQVR